MKKTQTTEATAKGWKLLMIFSVLCILAGIVVGIIGFRQESPAQTGAGMILFLVGGIGWFVAKFFAWWFHG